MSVPAVAPTASSIEIQKSNKSPSVSSSSGCGTRCARKIPTIGTAALAKRHNFLVDAAARIKATFAAPSKLQTRSRRSRPKICYIAPKNQVQVTLMRPRCSCESNSIDCEETTRCGLKDFTSLKRMQGKSSSLTSNKDRGNEIRQGDLHV